MATVRIVRPAFARAVVEGEGEGAVAAAEQVVLAARPTTGADPSPRVRVLLASYGAVALAVVAAFVVEGRLAAPLQLAAGASAFALFYVAAQAIERLLEPVASVVMSTEDAKKTVEEKKARAATEPSQDAAQAAAREAADATVALERKKAERVVAFWSLASIVGIVAAAVGGLYFLDMLVESPVSRAFDAAVTGLVIGGGTKLVHDLITRVQKAKESGEDSSS